MHLLSINQPLLSAYAQADFFGKAIFFSLFLLSIVCWIVLIHKIFQIHRIKKLSRSFEKIFSKHSENLLTLSVEQLPKLGTKEALHPFAKIFQSLKQKTLESLNKNHFFSEEKENIYLSPSDLELVESFTLTTISSEIKRLEKNLFILSTISTLAPFLGLLGTVWGILVTFNELQLGGNAASNSAILGGLSTALATTVLGLVIAIPALIAYNYLKNSFKYFASDMEDFLYQTLSTLELQYRKPL